MGSSIPWIVLVVILLCTVGSICLWIGYRLGQRSAVPWLVRPHTARTLARMPLPEEGYPTVSQAAYVRTNLPNSTSKME